MRNCRKLLIYGSSSLAEKIYYYNKRDNLYDIIAFVDNQEQSTLFHGIPVVSYEYCRKHYSKDEYVFFVAVGYTKCNSIREVLCNTISEDGYELINYISPNSIVFDNVILGHNILICDNVFVGHSSEISDGVVLSVGCILSHENKIGKYSFLSSAVVMGGLAVVENNCFIGIHTTLRDHVKIGEYSIVGSGTNVIKSTQAYSLTKGNPGVSEIKDTLSITI